MELKNKKWTEEEFLDLPTPPPEESEDPIF